MGRAYATLEYMAEEKDAFSLKFGYWFAVHRDQLRTWWAMSILVADVLLLIVFVVMFTTYSFSTMRTVSGISRMAEPLVSPQLQNALAPKDLVTEDAVALDRGNGRYDFIVPVTNPNPLWAAVEVTFHFTYGSETSRDERSTLWPAAESYLTQMNVAMAAPSAATVPQVVIVDVAWAHPSDLSMFTGGVVFPLSDVSIRPVTGLAAGVVGTRFTASVTNRSVYAFTSVRFVIVMKRGGTIAAIGDVLVERFKALETRTIEASWLQSLPSNAEVTVTPVLDLLDAASFQ